MPLFLEKQTGSMQDLRALIGETQNQPTEKHTAAISNRKTIYPSVKVNIWRQVSENRGEERGGRGGGVSQSYKSKSPQLHLSSEFSIERKEKLQPWMLFSECKVQIWNSSFRSGVHSSLKKATFECIYLFACKWKSHFTIESNRFCCFCS